MGCSGEGMENLHEEREADKQAPDKREGSA